MYTDVRNFSTAESKNSAGLHRHKTATTRKWLHMRIVLKAKKEALRLKQKRRHYASLDDFVVEPILRFEP